MEGVIFELTNAQLKQLDEKEAGYHREIVQASYGNRALDVATYVADQDKVNDNLSPSKEYLNVIISAAESHELSAGYIDNLRLSLKN